MWFEGLQVYFYGGLWNCFDGPAFTYINVVSDYKISMLNKQQRIAQCLKITRTSRWNFPAKNPLFVSFCKYLNFSAKNDSNAWCRLLMYETFFHIFKHCGIVESDKAKDRNFRLRVKNQEFETKIKNIYWVTLSKCIPRIFTNFLPFLQNRSDWYTNLMSGKPIAQIKWDSNAVWPLYRQSRIRTWCFHHQILPNSMKKLT